MAISGAIDGVVGARGVCDDILETAYGTGIKSIDFDDGFKGFDLDTNNGFFKKADDVVDELDDVADEIITDGSHLDNGKLKSNVKYKTGEYDYFYETDANGRISKWITDDLKLTKRDTRLKHNSNSPGKLSGDHAGHIVGDRFGGSPDLDNIVSQSQKVNLSEYKKIENEWATAIKKGKKVSVKVEVKYDGSGLRPVEFNVSYNIGEDFYKKTIIN